MTAASDPSDRVPHRDAKTIALCLSGGGFRATFFHLGVLQFLAEHGQLENVRTIVGVSGGSITAAYLAVCRTSGTASAQTLERAVKRIRQVGASDVRGWIIRRWLHTLGFGELKVLSWQPFSTLGRPRLLVSRWAKEFGDRDLEALGSQPGGDSLNIHLLATSSRTGRMCVFTGDGVLFEDEARPDLPDRHPATSISLAFAVAASSAFPPLFPPLRITRRQLAKQSKEFQLEDDYLADGGVYDNTGVAYVRRLYERQECAAAHVVISDASGQFDWDTQGSLSNVIARNVRATDILMNRIAALERIAPLVHPRIAKVSRVEIGAVVRPAYQGALSKEVQQRLMSVRTDLDEFAPDLQELLMQRGREAAASALPHLAAKESVPTTPVEMGLPQAAPHQRDALAQLLNTAPKRSFGVWRWSDPATYSLVIVMLLMVAVGAWAVTRAYQRARLALAQVIYMYGPQQTGPQFAARWISSAEYSAIATQTYRTAAQLLDVAIADRRWSAVASPPGAEGLPPAVLLDVDQAALDNNGYYQELAEKQAAFSAVTWDAFVRRANAPAVPGAVEFARLANEKGVQVLFATARDDSLDEPTVRNLIQQGFPVDVLRGAIRFRPRGLNPRGLAEAHNKYFAARYRVVMQFGESLDDFLPDDRPGNTPAARPEQPWGTKWFLLPNPMYGPWERRSVSGGVPPAH